MTQEEKNILRQVLCTMLPYGVQIYCEKGESKFNFTLYGIRGNMLISKNIYEEKTYSKGIVSKHYEYPIYSSFLKIICKPYLRPMESMTDVEREEWFKQSRVEYDCEFHTEPTLSLCNCYLSTDWLDKKMFDYRGLIPMGLALEAKKGMYNIK